MRMKNKHKTASERHKRNMAIKEEWDNYEGDRWHLTTPLSEKYGISTVLCRKIIKNPNIDKKRAEVEKQVIDMWNALEGETRFKLAIMSDELGLKKTQIRYIVKNIF